MKILVTGASGQVGWELSRSLMPLGEIVAVDLDRFDLGRPETLARLLDEIRPAVIANAAAYTAVDKAEDEEQLATVVNGTSVGVLAEWARANDALLVHYSTDYVFDGASDRPYVETDEPRPLNAYGRSKLAGERALAAVGASYLCLRTSWVYSTRGRNFLLTMLRLGREHEELRVVADQIGAPTWARNLADVTGLMVSNALDRIARGRFESGLYHLTATGETSWHGFAERIFALARAAGRDLAVRHLEAIDSASWPTPARRSRYSLLSNEALRSDWRLQLPPWTVSVDAAMQGLDLSL